jgi:peroxiredoxin Q/BCP
MTIGSGDVAPDFVLPGIEGVGTPAQVARDYSLAEFRGRPVVLIFYPGDNTPVCTVQLNAYTHDIDAFDAVGAQVLAISPQSVESHAHFSCEQGSFAFPMLADVGQAVGEAYGILGPLGFYRRSAFVVDASGTIAYVHRSVGSMSFRPTEELVAAVAAAAT